MNQLNLFKFGENPQPTPRILLITSCSKLKLDHPAPARELYQGALFKKVKNLAIKLGAEVMILSAKHGLIASNQKIAPYEKQIEDKEDIQELRKTELPKLKKIAVKYDKIFIIMGKKYRRVLDPILKKDSRFHVFKSELGTGGYLQMLDSLFKSTYKSLITPNKMKKKEDLE